MRALVKARAEAGLWMQDVPEPTVGRDDVLIRVLRTGICGTDLHIYTWDSWAQHNIPVPLVVGRRPPRMRALSQLHGRTACPVRPH
jgi:threonine 3-dehydrogenase